METHHVSITPSGRIRFSRHFIGQYELHKETAVELYPDDEDSIHLDFIHSSDAIDGESLPLVLTRLGRSAYIDAASFFKDFDLAPYANTPLSIRHVLTDDLATEFIIYLDKA